MCICKCVLSSNMPESVGLDGMELTQVQGLYRYIGFSSGAKDTCRLTTIPCWVARAAHVSPGGPNTVHLYEASLHGTVQVGLQGCRP